VALSFRNYKSLRKPKLYHKIDKINYLLETATLAKRSKLDQRLVTAFGIDNAFTTFDKKYHNEFTRRIENNLKNKDNLDDRIQLARKASVHIQEYIQEYEDMKTPMPLVKLIQVLVFKTVVTIFFSNEEEIIIKFAEKITSLISSVWYDSKSPAKIAENNYSLTLSSITRDRQEFHGLIKDVCQDALWHMRMSDPIPTRDNPLNVLLPAYMGICSFKI
jgi:hypothetical protein